MPIIMARYILLTTIIVGCVLKTTNSFNTQGIPEKVFVEYMTEYLATPDVTDPDHPHHVFYQEAINNNLQTLLDPLNLMKLEASAGIPNVSEQCVKDSYETFMSYTFSLGLFFLDAWGKPTPGVFQGSTKWTGDYQQCIGLKSPVINQTVGNTTKDYQFYGRYCNIYLASTAKKNMLTSDPKTADGFSKLGPIGLGACVPDSCSFVDLWVIVAENLYMLTTKIGVVYVDCQPSEREDVHFTPAAKGMIAVLSLLALLMVIGTVYDVVIYQPRINRSFEKLEVLANDGVGPQTEPGLVAEVEQVPNRNGYGYETLHNEHGVEISVRHEPVKAQPTTLDQIFLSFSVLANGAKVLNVGKPPDSNLGAVHGIRFLSMSWVILGHTLVFLFSIPGFFVIRNLAIAPDLLKRFTFQAISGATVSVDSFFLLSGTLVTYLTLIEISKKTSPWKINWLLYYFHRFWRLTPAYMLVLGSYVALASYLGSGPYWPTSHVPVNCTWWTNLLYINNIVKPDQMCIAWSWFLANDMQFFIITPFLIVPLYYSGIVGGILTGVLFVASIITTGVISGVNHFLPGMIGGLTPLAQSPDFVNYTQQHSFNDLYIPPHTRIGPYLIGVMLGYILYRTNRKVKMHWIVALSGWLIASACLAIPVYGLYGIANGTTTMSNGVSALFNAVHRSVWGLGLAWVIFACVTGYGGFVNTILSWTGLVPLSRLTYMAYLIHPVVMFSYIMQIKQTIIYDDFTFIYLFLSNITLSYMVAFVLTLAFESPMMALEKVVFGRFK